MSKVNVKKGDGQAPKPLVEKILVGQQLPVTVQLTHQARKGLVIPSTGIAEVIPPGVPTAVKIRSADQAWLLVTDLATFAELGNNTAENFGCIELPAAPAAGGKPKKTNEPGSVEQ